MNPAWKLAARSLGCDLDFAGRPSYIQRMSPNPSAVFRKEWERARSREPFDGCRAVLATADESGRPSARYVLVKEVDERGFWVYTNYKSRKAAELDRNPFAALCWHWHATGVQVRVEGEVLRAPTERSDAYFKTRPRESQLGAWASKQSAVIDGDQPLQERVDDLRARFEGESISRPEFWGGYVVQPTSYEFWYEGEARLHARTVYRREGADGWCAAELFP